MGHSYYAVTHYSFAHYYYDSFECHYSFQCYAYSFVRCCVFTPTVLAIISQNITLLFLSLVLLLHLEMIHLFMLSHACFLSLQASVSSSSNDRSPYLTISKVLGDHYVTKMATQLCQGGTMNPFCASLMNLGSQSDNTVTLASLEDLMRKVIFSHLFLLMNQRWSDLLNKKKL